MNKEDKRVFCKDCEFLDCDYVGWGERKYYCKAEGNKNFKPDWHKNWYILIRKPRKINKFNDCRWYKEALLQQITNHILNSGEKK